MERARTAPIKTRDPVHPPEPTRLHRSNTALLVIDLQEKLMPVISNGEEVIRQTLNLMRAAQVLELPVFVTEQYPKGLGHTCKEVELPASQEVIEKMCFSCMLSDEVNRRLKSLNIEILVLSGVEAHICVLKTALDALKNGYEVHVAADAVSTRIPGNKPLALERMRQSGVFIASTEMVLFQLMDQSGTDEFKQISKLIK